jgi:hypothetical protein
MGVAFAAGGGSYGKRRLGCGLDDAITLAAEERREVPSVLVVVADTLKLLTTEVTLGFDVVRHRRPSDTGGHGQPTGGVKMKTSTPTMSVRRTRDIE